MLRTTTQHHPSPLCSVRHGSLHSHFSMLSLTSASAAEAHSRENRHKTQGSRPTDEFCDCPPRDVLSAHLYRHVQPTTSCVSAIHAALLSGALFCPYRSPLYHSVGAQERTKVQLCILTWPGWWPNSSQALSCETWPLWRRCMAAQISEASLTSVSRHTEKSTAVRRMW